MPGTPPARIFVARFAGTGVFDPNGDHVGRVRDAVVTLRSDDQPPRLLGIIVEVPGRRRIFVPMTRVTRIDTGAVITTGLVNLRRFEKRSGETLVLGELIDHSVTLRESGETVLVVDMAFEQQRSRDWRVVKVAISRAGKRFRRGATAVLDWDQVAGLSIDQADQGTTHLLASLEEMRPADLANLLLDLSPKRRGEVVNALEDERLADVLEELSEDAQVEIIGQIESERAADVLEEMSPDDAADLIAELPPERAEQLLALMDPEESGPVRRLMSYAERTAGGLMTSEPVILPPDATVADALATIRNPELSPAMAASVFVCRPPLETPTGRLVGVAHLQRLLREMPSALVSGVIDSALDPISPDTTLQEVASYLAAYNLLSAPVVDDAGRLLGAVTVDDVLDHLLPENWRDARDRTPSGATASASAAGAGGASTREAPDDGAA